MVVLLAEYAYKQWGSEQTPENEIHADDCYRWQAGIEAAGGTWDGEWIDLDRTGKGLITIDQFNALESQIQSKVSSYTPKGYDPDSTVQIVPGPDGWNKVEDGILKAVCTPDGVNRNYLLNTHDLTNEYGKVWIASTGPDSETDENGFGVRVFPAGLSTSCNLIISTSVDPTDDQWAGKPVIFSCEMKLSNLDSISNNGFYFGVWSGRATSYSGYRKCYVYSSFARDTVFTFNRDEWTDEDWFKFTALLPEIPKMADMTQDSSNYDMPYRYGVQFYRNSNLDSEMSMRKPKLELASEATEWSPAMEDYGYGDNVATATATPQSVENSDEVAAPEAEEIE